MLRQTNRVCLGFLQLGVLGLQRLLHYLDLRGHVIDILPQAVLKTSSS